MGVRQALTAAPRHVAHGCRRCSRLSAIAVYRPITPPRLPPLTPCGAAVPGPGAGPARRQPAGPPVPPRSARTRQHRTAAASPDRSPVQLGALRQASGWVVHSVSAPARAPQPGSPAPLPALPQRWCASSGGAARRRGWSRPAWLTWRIVRRSCCWRRRRAQQSPRAACRRTSCWAGWGAWWGSIWRSGRSSRRAGRAAVPPRRAALSSWHGCW